MHAPLRPGDPERVREYRLTARLGEGGQGTVFLGMSPTGTRVAVKLLRADLAQDEEALERFVREVSTTRRVSPFCTATAIGTPPTWLPSSSRERTPDQRPTCSPGAARWSSRPAGVRRSAPTACPRTGPVKAKSSAAAPGSRP
ncbi:hypothetical protein ACFQ0B_45135 [Nonomuraea thailandensis]